ncbi:hypothetical protein EXIGLDRAFT_674015 [Exidia glandulosa HHB12029]|uniref:MYND-type domain-containing protein n=1 Tax=Exidia glandulosa HHB12029 TaxID=1314781 RepID=A0A166AMG0_EXIGL|nr:hypothetical protein EXIGLDRAFT_674015 [Exidia glandulosa HHB12029]
MSTHEFAEYNLARAITAAIRDCRDKPKPALCVQAVGKGLLILTTGTALVKGLRTTYAELADNALNLLSTPMSEDEMASLATKWSVCRCNLAQPIIRSIHESGGDRGRRRTLPQVVTSLFSILSIALGQITPTKLHKSALQGKWPPSVAHLVPHGPQSLIDTMIRWTRYTSSEVPYQTFPLHYLAKVSTICAALRRPIYESSDVLQCFASRWHELASAFESTEMLTLDALPFPDPAYALSHLFDVEAAMTEAILECIKRLETHFTPQAHLIFPAIERVREALPPWRRIVEEPFEDYDELRDTLQQHARMFWVALPAEERPQREFPAWTRAIVNAFDPCGLAYSTMNHWGRLNACAGPSCFVPGEALGEPLRVCQRCKVLRYCSRECQKEHWNWRKSPHKTSCAFIGNTWTMVKKFDKPEFDGMDRAELFREAIDSWDDFEVASNALACLAREKEERRDGAL